MRTKTIFGVAGLVLAGVTLTGCETGRQYGNMDMYSGGPYRGATAQGPRGYNSASGGYTMNSGQQPQNVTAAGYQQNTANQQNAPYMGNQQTMSMQQQGMNAPQNMQPQGTNAPQNMQPQGTNVPMEMQQQSMNVPQGMTPQMGMRQDLYGNVQQVGAAGSYPASAYQNAMPAYQTAQNAMQPALSIPANPAGYQTVPAYGNGSVSANVPVLGNMSATGGVSVGGNVPANANLSAVGNMPAGASVSATADMSGNGNANIYTPNITAGARIHSNTAPVSTAQNYSGPSLSVPAQSYQSPVASVTYSDSTPTPSPVSNNTMQSPSPRQWDEQSMRSMARPQTSNNVDEQQTVRNSSSPTPPTPPWPASNTAVTTMPEPPPPPPGYKPSSYNSGMTMHAQ